MSDTARHEKLLGGVAKKATRVPDAGPSPDDKARLERLGAGAAIPRWGHGRSSQPWHGNDLDAYAEDFRKTQNEAGISAPRACRTSAT